MSGRNEGPRERSEPFVTTVILTQGKAFYCGPSFHRSLVPSFLHSVLSCQNPLSMSIA